MNKRIGIFIFLVLAGFSLLAGPVPEARDLRVTVLYDNYTAVEGVQADWGFSCLVQGVEKTILFDAGSRAAILRKNVSKPEGRSEPGRFDRALSPARRPHRRARVGFVPKTRYSRLSAGHGR